MREVTTGRQDEKIAVITSGLQPGEVVITSGFSRLTDGAKIQIMNAPSAASAEDVGASGEDQRSNAARGAPTRRTRGNRTQR
jgi:multidrug efflux system membrane fusion protein